MPNVKDAAVSIKASTIYSSCTIPMKVARVLFSYLFLFASYTSINYNKQTNNKINLLYSNNKILLYSMTINIIA
jgi:hypothetical protein